MYTVIRLERKQLNSARVDEYLICKNMSSSKIQRTRIEIDEEIDNKTSCMFYT